MSRLSEVLTTFFKKRKPGSFFKKEIQHGMCDKAQPMKNVVFSPNQIFEFSERAPACYSSYSPRLHTHCHSHYTAKSISVIKIDMLFTIVSNASLACVGFVMPVCKAKHNFHQHFSSYGWKSNQSIPNGAVILIIANI